MNNEDGLSEFMKFAYKCNKVRNITEAFEEYPAQEEWHKGKIENFGMLISSKIDKIKYKGNLLLEKSKENGLNMDSIVKTDIVYKILNGQIMFKIGSVDKDKVEEYKASFYEINK